MLATLAGMLWDRLEPFLLAKWKEVEPKLEVWVKDKFDEWAPRILKTILVGMAQAGGQLVINSTDKVTDFIPGKVDDDVIDPMVRNGMQQLERWLPGVFNR